MDLKCPFYLQLYELTLSRFEKERVASQGRVQQKLQKVSYVLNKNQQLCFITPLLEPTYVSSHGCVVGLPIMEALVSLIDWNAG